MANISKIQLPGINEPYDIYDASAFHSIEDLGLSAVMDFKGVVNAVSNLPTNGRKGDVYAVKEASSEYVCTGHTNGNAVWEELGPVREIASSSHTHAIIKNTFEAHNEPSVVTGTVTVPSITKESSKLSATASKPNITTGTDSVLGADTTFTVSGGTKRYINPSISPVSVAGNGSGQAVSGYGDVSKQSVVTQLNSTKINNPSVTSVSIPNVTGNTSVTAAKITDKGTLPTWSAKVEGEVLSFEFNKGALVEYENVTATNTVLGAAISASSVSTDEVTVATGVKDSVSAITDLGAPTTFTALTGVKVSTQPTVELALATTSGDGGVQVVTDVSSVSVTASGDNVTALTSAELAAAPTITLNDKATTGVDFVSSVTINSAQVSLIDGEAEAQNWTFVSGETGTPRG